MATPCWPVFQLPHWHRSSEPCTQQHAQPRDRVIPVLQDLRWLPVAERSIQYKLACCLLVHKSLLGHMPEYMSDLLMPVDKIAGRSALPASSRGDLVVPRTRRRIGDRAFSVAAPRAWNRLPTELKPLRSTDSFRPDLKTFLFDSLFTGTRIRIHPVMRPRSSRRGRNTSASATVTVTVKYSDTSIEMDKAQTAFSLQQQTQTINSQCVSTTAFHCKTRKRCNCECIAT